MHFPVTARQKDCVSRLPAECVWLIKFKTPAYLGRGYFMGWLVPEEQFFNGRMWASALHYHSKNFAVYRKPMQIRTLATINENRTKIENVFYLFSQKSKIFASFPKGEAFALPFGEGAK